MIGFLSGARPATSNDSPSTVIIESGGRLTPCLCLDRVHAARRYDDVIEIEILPGNVRGIPVHRPLASLQNLPDATLAVSTKPQVPYFVFDAPNAPDSHDDGTAAMDEKHRGRRGECCERSVPFQAATTQSITATT